MEEIKKVKEETIDEKTFSYWATTEKELKEKYFAAAAAREKIIQKMIEKLGLEREAVVKIINYCSKKSFFPEKFLIFSIPISGIKVVVTEGIFSSSGGGHVMPFIILEERVVKFDIWDNYPRYPGVDIEENIKIETKTSLSPRGIILEVIILTIGKRGFKFSLSKNE